MLLRPRRRHEPKVVGVYTIIKNGRVLEVLVFDDDLFGSFYQVVGRDQASGPLSVRLQCRGLLVGDFEQRWRAACAVVAAASRAGTSRLGRAVLLMRACALLSLVRLVQLCRCAHPRVAKPLKVSCAAPCVLRAGSANAKCAGCWFCEVAGSRGARRVVHQSVNSHQCALSAGKSRVSLENPRVKPRFQNRSDCAYLPAFKRSLDALDAARL